MPAQAGIHASVRILILAWILAFARMTFWAEHAYALRAIVERDGLGAQPRAQRIEPLDLSGE